MSKENVEVARALHEFFNARDSDGLVGIMDEQVEFLPIMAKLEGAVYRGHQQVRNWMQEIDRDWAEFLTRPEEFHALKGDVVLTLGSWRARARTSGVTLDEQRGAWLTHLRAGKIVRHETFTDREEALRAAGITPEELERGGS